MKSDGGEGVLCLQKFTVVLLKKGDDGKEFENLFVNFSSIACSIAYRNNMLSRTVSVAKTLHQSVVNATLRELVKYLHSDGVLLRHSREQS